MTAEPVAALILELTDAHRDGTYYADGEGDIWSPAPWGWVVTGWLPMVGPTAGIAEPSVQYGPYRAVLGPDGKPVT